MADQTGKTCKVCKKDVSGARQCQQCKEFDKKEGYWQYVVSIEYM